MPLARGGNSLVERGVRPRVKALFLWSGEGLAREECAWLDFPVSRNGRQGRFPFDITSILPNFDVVLDTAHPGNGASVALAAAGHPDKQRIAAASCRAKASAQHSSAHLRRAECRSLLFGR